MNTTIKRYLEVDRNLNVEKPNRMFNPDGMDHTKTHRIKSIEASDEHTRIDFIFRSSMIYVNGGWIQMDRGAYIQPVGSTVKYRLLKTIGIPIAPLKHYFKRNGEYFTYTLIYPALPKNTTQINIIEKEAAGTYFNFYNVDFSSWMTVPHAADISRSQN
jgi:hypothetical protein